MTSGYCIVIINVFKYRWRGGLTRRERWNSKKTRRSAASLCFTIIHVKQWNVLSGLQALAAHRWIGLVYCAIIVNPGSRYTFLPEKSLDLSCVLEENKILLRFFWLRKKPFWIVWMLDLKALRWVVALEIVYRGLFCISFSGDSRLRD